MCRQGGQYQERGLVNTLPPSTDRATEWASEGRQILAGNERTVQIWNVGPIKWISSSANHASPTALHTNFPRYRDSHQTCIFGGWA